MHIAGVLRFVSPPAGNKLLTVQFELLRIPLSSMVKTRLQVHLCGSKTIRSRSSRDLALLCNHVWPSDSGLITVQDGLILGDLLCRGDVRKVSFSIRFRRSHML